MIGDSRNRGDLVSAEFVIFDFQVYFVPELNSTPDTFHKAHNSEQEYVSTSSWYHDLAVGRQ